MKTGKIPSASLIRVFVIGLLILGVGAFTSSARAVGEPDLKITLTHTGNFDIGTTNTYTLKVDNIDGGSDVNAPIDVEIVFPRGLTFDSYSGIAWVCNVTFPVTVNFDFDIYTCSYSGNLLGSLNLPNETEDLILTVLVDTNEFPDGTFPDSLNTSASVAVASGEVDEVDNETSDPTGIDKSDLDIIAVSFNPVQPLAGQPFEVLVTIRNDGHAGSESVVYRSVFVDHHPFDLDPDGCATISPSPADYSDWERGNFNDAIVAGGEIQQPVSTLTHGPSPTYGFSLPEGTFQIYVMADATCINRESNEYNNVYGPITLTVIEATDPPPPPGECGHVFRDVATAYWACSFIETLSKNGVTGGCRVDADGKDYCPDDPVTRAQMAVFLERGIKGSTFAPPNIAATFLDTVGHWAMIWIEALKSDRITSGCLAGYYCPDSSTTRAQMAVFLLKSKSGYGPDYVPPAVGGSTGFADVPADYWAAAWIKQLAAEGITGGCGSGIYCPESSVTRAQMAVFLVRTFGLK